MELLKRVYAYEVLVCDACGGRWEVLAFLTEGETVRKFLECVGLSSDIPPISPPSRLMGHRRMIHRSARGVCV
ncbi:MAG: hypothetical protein HY720_15860 [Planctomycetes bacterium]|nr:hypothetical protein [Planctomycetota bacterium]